jgi:metal transporter CNNM
MDGMEWEFLTWVGIALCISQSATFSGLNLAMFGVSRLRLEVEFSTGNTDAGKILELRKDANLLLTTILWGNVGINVLLTLLSNSVLTGVSAFLFSTVAITFLGEIIPQAYFSRHAIRMGAMLAPVIQFYQFILFPVAKPSAWVLDRWLGKESISFFREQGLRAVIQRHLDAGESEIDRLEGMGALNFLSMDDLHVREEGEPVDPDSVFALPFENCKPIFPKYQPISSDPLIRQIYSSRKKWVILTDFEGIPQLALNASDFIAEAFFQGKNIDPISYYHRPIIVSDGCTPLGKALLQLKVIPERDGDDVIDHDIIESCQ